MTKTIRISFAEKRRRKVLGKLVDLAMDHGTSVYLQSGDLWLKYRNPEDRNPEAIHADTTRMLDDVAKSNRQVLKHYYKRAVIYLHAQDAANDFRAKLEKRTTDAARIEILVELYRAGDTDHPAYAALAAASTMQEIRAIKRFV